MARLVHWMSYWLTMLLASVSAWDWYLNDLQIGIVVTSVTAKLELQGVIPGSEKAVVLLLNKEFLSHGIWIYSRLMAIAPFYKGLKHNWQSVDVFVLLGLKVLDTGPTACQGREPFKRDIAYLATEGTGGVFCQ